MPVQADYADELVTLRLIGEYSYEDMRQAFYAALPGTSVVARGLLIDVTQSISIRTRASGDVRAMSRWWAAHGAQFQRRLAMVADGNVEYGITRLVASEAEREGLTVGVFRDESEARAWLLAFVTTNRPATSWRSQYDHAI